jgi:hypothetical protein
VTTGTHPSDSAHPKGSGGGAIFYSLPHRRLVEHVALPPSTTPPITLHVAQTPPRRGPPRLANPHARTHAHHSPGRPNAPAAWSATHPIAPSQKYGFQVFLLCLQPARSPERLHVSRVAVPCPHRSSPRGARSNSQPAHTPSDSAHPKGAGGGAILSALPLRRLHRARSPAAEHHAAYHSPRRPLARAAWPATTHPRPRPRRRPPPTPPITLPVAPTPPRRGPPRRTNSHATPNAALHSPRRPLARAAWPTTTHPRARTQGSRAAGRCRRWPPTDDSIDGAAPPLPQSPNPQKNQRPRGSLPGVDSTERDQARRCALTCGWRACSRRRSRRPSARSCSCRPGTGSTRSHSSSAPTAASPRCPGAPWRTRRGRSARGAGA